MTRIFPLLFLVGLAHAESIRPVRCAVIGGVTASGLWAELARRFEDETNTRVIVVATGNKDVIVPFMERGEVDLFTMHASDAIINLVADGHALDPQPWARNELVLVGPTADPAHVRGSKDAAEAMRRIATAHATLVLPRGAGGREMVHGIMRDASLSPDAIATLEGPDGPQVAQFAAHKNAYALVGMIPLSTGKMDKDGLEVMLRGDARLRRPYLVVVANPKRWPAANHAGAAALARFLRSPSTQAFIASFHAPGSKTPLFFPVAAETR
jgi:tungstate transport system substrate-binding protein